MGSQALTCFGTGDGWPCADRFHSAFLYEFSGATLLIDCGEPVSRGYKATGLDYNRIDRIFLTHLHFDHVGGLFMLIQGFWLEGRQQPLTIHLPGEGIEPITRMLDAGYVFHDLLPFSLGFDPLRPAEPIEVNGIRVTAHPTTHLDRLRAAFSKRYPKPYSSFCFLLETNGLRIAHSGDLGAVSDLAPLLEEEVDLLVCELAHVEVEDLTSFLRKRGVRRVVFVHMERRLREDVERTRERIARGLGEIPFLLAEDGQRVPLERMPAI